MCLKLTIKTPVVRPHWRRSGVFIVNFEHISHLVLVFLLLTLNMQIPTELNWNSLKNDYFSKLAKNRLQIWTTAAEFKYFITTLINAEQLSCRSPLESSSASWKSGENFNLEELTNSMLVGYNFTENFTVDVAVGIFRNVWNNIHSCFYWRIYRSITIKSNQFAGKKYRSSDFWRNKESKFLHDTLQSKKMNNKRSQVLLLLVFRKTPRRWNYGWRPVLKTCTALIVGIFEQIFCFDELFLMALTSTEQRFIERPLYKRFLYIDHVPYFQ